MLRPWLTWHLRHGRRSLQRDGAAEGLPVQEALQWRRVVDAEGCEGGFAVVEHRANVRGVALEALGEGVALVVNGEPRLGKVDGGGLDSPVKLWMTVTTLRC